MMHFWILKTNEEEGEDLGTEVIMMHFLDTQKRMKKGEDLGTGDNDAFPGYSRKQMKKKTLEKGGGRKEKNLAKNTYLDTRIAVNSSSNL
ncbi:hypothetical protein AVEN_275531-1 [Araneus ventricosus]|uniref:Uncharacterized protein n=1 Tax=Araneus ventricosus TaxID=182803 RepID=A0A4Y2XBH7_ARAVE|nr:hypothetical protein AVEN_275531-1 [Araneus ventricosus]